MAEVLPITNPFLPMFHSFRAELDAHHDLRERVIKVSRDVTALSKKMIFTLQRTPTLPCSSLPSSLQEELRPRLSQIHMLLASLATDLAPDTPNYWRYHRQLSGAMQEFVEAVAFEHYLVTQRLISPAEAAQRLVPPGDALGSGGKDTEITGLDVRLMDGDYLLGIFDLVGEMMRWGITHLATSAGGDRKQPKMRGILEDMRELRGEMERLDPGRGGGIGRETEKKMDVMRTCVEKVEVGVCGVMVRGSERGPGWVPDLGSAERDGREDKSSD